MSLVKTFEVGSIRCHTLDAGMQRLDGGAMFGVVPKPLWERKIAADERNRIPLALRCLLIEHSDALILVDTGVGNKESDKFTDIYGVENGGENGPTQLEDALKEAGFSAEDVDYVVNTHLHFDHAGGNTYSDGETVEPSFPNATYVVQSRELEFGKNTNERTAPSYLPHNIEPVPMTKWRLLEGEEEILPGIRAIPTPGHVPYHQSILIADGGVTACYVGDLIPTTAHVPLPWIMGYDLEPLVTLETKRQLAERALAEEWLMVFEHDPRGGFGRMVRDGKRLGVDVIDNP